MAKEIIFSDSIYTSTLKDDVLDKHIQTNLKKAKEQNQLRIISNQGGLQTSNILDKTFADCLRESIKNGLDAFQVKAKRIWMTSAWVNENKKGDYNILHVHPKASFVGNYYSIVPENSGDINFYRNDVSVLMQKYASFFLTTDSFCHYALTPQSNLFMIFPAHLQHEVKPNNSNESRISLSFNINVE
jgi:uncharacterized protein (TIGR02466 family)